jgi:Tol biopolymer transport system component
VRGIVTRQPAIWVARDDGRGAHKLVAGAGPRISPDGRLVAYAVAGAQGTSRLMVVSATGGQARLLLAMVLAAIERRDVPG